jgi:hypothetical protein
VLAYEDAKLILVIDQLEELFAVPDIGAEERRRFIALLGGLARSGAVWVIVTLRVDFWHRAAEIPELVALAEGQGRLDVAAPSLAELAEMIRKPAQAAGLSLEAHAETGLGLDAVLAEHAAAAPGVLPLLSFTLDKLYKEVKARGETVLTHASYAALGGLEGAIAKRGWAANFSPDGLHLVTASFDQTARIWRLYPTTQALIEDAKKVIPRCLTRGQRQRFFLDAEPPA